MDQAPYWGLVGVVLGGLLAQVANWVDHRRQRRERLEDFLRTKLEQREAFELEHLVEVNQLLRNLRRRGDELISAKKPDPRYAKPPDDHAERCRTAIREADAALDAQVGFILDDKVRELVKAAADRILDRAWTVYQEAPATFEEAIQRGTLGIGIYTAIEETHEAAEAAYEAISERVRELYAGFGEPRRRWPFSSWSREPGPTRSGHGAESR
ncbi:hypothetical protein HHL19_18650 [Streptomyces sp. R302]|uniref:hypothetical protein n=1 Tax=unclassified Streptomyces TaxID=2593676 RepID=UPI00145D66E8|nr:MULTISPECIES: hypothetical protein [unclassified Streptomyces]NML54798.1 hypothetical protein [Streptomyces sp. R301]NML80633.1 hypothetical protein [Streptomyces sp. R302]